MAELETRDSGARVSSHINRKPAANLLNAINTARHIGRPLNQFVTLTFSHTDCPAALVSRQFERLRDNHFAPWLRRKGKVPAGPPTYVWCIENTGACAVHWLVHIPRGRVGAFKQQLPAWLRAVAGEVHCQAAIHVRYARTPAGAGKYMVKGLDPMYAPLYGIRHEPQGTVHGRRSGFSRCLGPTARRRLVSAGKAAPLRKIAAPRKRPPASAEA